MASGIDHRFSTTSDAVQMTLKGRILSDTHRVYSMVLIIISEVVS